MDYRGVYDRLMARARLRHRPSGYCERHHIVPRSLKGSDKPENVVALTYREHFLAHWLLTKFLDGDARRKMLYALNRMTAGQAGRVVAGWQYDLGRKAQRDGKIGTKASEAVRLKQAAALKGNKNSLGVKHGPQMREKTSARLKGNKYSLGFAHTGATKRKRSAASKSVWASYSEDEKAARIARVSAGFARRREHQGIKPWVALGMSHRTWYRRGKPLPSAAGGSYR